MLWPSRRLEKLRAISARLGDAVIDPAVWRDIMEEISVAAGAVERDDPRCPTTRYSRNVNVIRISDISERYFEFYKRLPQRKTPLVIGGE